MTTTTTRKKLLPSTPPSRATPSSNQILGLYDLEETLGKGHYATVKAARHVFTSERVAVKVIEKSKLDAGSQKSLLKEVLCMKLVQHPHVVRLYEVIDTSSRLFLVLELGAGDLYDLIEKRKAGLEEDLARHYFSQIVAAVSYCHKLHVVHRDLKPENVVYFPQTSSVKLTDFGFSNKFCPGVKLDTSCGSLAYSAPEILLGDSYDAPAVDMWSLGVILYMLATGHAPFQEANDSETLTMIMDVKYSIPSNISPPLKNLIEKMLKKRPEERVRIGEVEGHPWMEGESNNLSSGSENPLISSYKLGGEEKNQVIGEMVRGGVVEDPQQVIVSLKRNAYNYITSTFYLLAEKMLRERKDFSKNYITLSGSLESLNSSSSQGTVKSGSANQGQSSIARRRSSVLLETTTEELESPPTSIKQNHSNQNNKILNSSSCSSGFNSETTKELEEEEEEAEEEEKIKKSKRKNLFSWLFNKNSKKSPGEEQNNSKIYKTKSCSELKNVNK